MQEVQSKPIGSHYVAENMSCLASRVVAINVCFSTIDFYPSTSTQPVTWSAQITHEAMIAYAATLLKFNCIATLSWMGSRPSPATWSRRAPYHCQLPADLPPERAVVWAWCVFCGHPERHPNSDANAWILPNGWSDPTGFKASFSNTLINRWSAQLAHAAMAAFRANMLAKPFFREPVSK